MDEEKAWQIVAVASAAMAGIAARNIMQHGWKVFRRDEPPENPAALSVSWTDAILWTAGTGAVVGLTRMLAERGAAAGWRELRGDYPPGLD